MAKRKRVRLTRKWVNGRCTTPLTAKEAAGSETGDPLSLREFEARMREVADREAADDRTPAQRLLGDPDILRSALGRIKAKPRQQFGEEDVENAMAFARLISPLIERALATPGFDAARARTNEDDWDDRSAYDD